jgi:hypothetical protein
MDVRTRFRIYDCHAAPALGLLARNEFMRPEKSEQ